MTLERRDIISGRVPFENEGPKPLRREVVEQEPYPFEALRDLLLPVRALAEHTRAPIEICAQSVLGALSLVLQAHADVVLPTGAARPLSLFLLTIAPSGERKSAVDSHALKPVYEYEVLLRDKHSREQMTYINKHELWSAKRAQALNLAKKRSKPFEGEADLRSLGDEPEAPLTPLLVCPEPTFEGYCKLTATGLPAMGIYSAEGGAFIGGFGMSADNRLKTSAGLSCLWDGDPIKRVRAGDGTMILPGRRLSLHLMAQPEVSDQLINDSLLVSQGLISRCLVTAPASAAGSRYFSPPSDKAKSDLADYHSKLRELLNHPLPITEGTRNELELRKLHMSPEAQQIWINWHDHVEARLIEDGEFSPIAGFANKAAEHAARIAGLMTLWRDLHALSIDAETMASSTRLVNHYLAEALRLRGLAGITPHLQLAERVLEWLRYRWHEPNVYPAAIYNDCPITAVRNRKAALNIIATLVEHGWLQTIEGGARINGAQRKEAWSIYGRVIDENLRV